MSYKLGEVDFYILERRTSICESSDSGIFHLIQHHECKNWYLERLAMTGRATGWWERRAEREIPLLLASSSDEAWASCTSSSLRGKKNNEIEIAILSPFKHNMFIEQISVITLITILTVSRTIKISKICIFFNIWKALKKIDAFSMKRKWNFLTDRRMDPNQMDLRR